MARPSRCRRICKEPPYSSFGPMEGAKGGQVCLTIDEYEVLRLVDYEKKTHEQCAKLMDISRTTVTEIYESARFKLADCLVGGKVLGIGGGNYRLCQGEAFRCCGKKCFRKEKFLENEKKNGGKKNMVVAVTYENGNVFQHFGHTEEFKIYEIKDNEISDSKVVGTEGSGHGALAGFLAERKVDVLICGGIGGGARNALEAAGIDLYGGVSGDADEAVKALLAGNLNYNPDVLCSHHHGGEHSCGDHHGEGHSCGEGHGGNHSCGGHHRE